MTVWARHHPATSWCFIVRVADGSYQTGCRGRWATTSSDFEIHDSPPRAERCLACWEIADAPLFQFDMSEGE